MAGELAPAAGGGLSFSPGDVFLMSLECPPKMSVSLWANDLREGAKSKLPPLVTQPENVHGSTATVLRWLWATPRWPHIRGGKNSKGSILKPPQVLVGSGDDTASRTPKYNPALI